MVYIKKYWVHSYVCVKFNIYVKQILSNFPRTATDIGQEKELLFP